MDHRLHAWRAPSRGHCQRPGQAGPRRSLVLVCAAAAAASVFAEPNPYYLGVSQSVMHDDNLLRLGDDQPAPPGSWKADTITSTGLLGGFDQNIGRQHLFGNMTVRDNRLKNNDIDNNTSYSLGGGIDWSTIDRLSGTLKANATQSLARFNILQDQTVVTRRNLESTRQFDALARLGGVTELGFEAGAGYRSVDYSAAEADYLDFHQNNLSFTVRWRPDGAANFGAGVRQARGEYPHFDASGGDAFTRRDIDLDITLLPDGVSSLLARLSFGKISYDKATQRDFSGVTGYLRWLWRPTGKLRLDTQLSRDPGQDSYFHNYGLAFDPNTGSIVPINGTIEYSRVTDSLRVRADYDATAKISLNATFNLAQRSIAQTQSVESESVTSNGSDRTRFFGFGASWTPLRSVQLGCDWSRERRTSSTPLSASYSDNVYSCYGQFTIQ